MLKFVEQLIVYADYKRREREKLKLMYKEASKAFENYEKKLNKTEINRKEINKTKINRKEINKKEPVNQTLFFFSFAVITLCIIGGDRNE